MTKEADGTIKRNFPRSNPQDNPRISAKVERLMREEGPEAVIATLTTKQALFVEEYVKDFDKDAALIRSGYNLTNKSNAAKMAYNMLAHPAIKVAVQYYTALRADKATMDVPYVEMQWLKLIKAMEANALKGDTKSAAILLRTTEVMARALGMFIDRQEITGKDGSAIQVEEIHDAADAFTRSITRLNERGGTDSVPVETRH